MNKVLIVVLATGFIWQTYQVHSAYDLTDEALDLGYKAVGIIEMYKGIVIGKDLVIKKLKSNQCATWSS